MYTKFTFGNSGGALSGLVASQSEGEDRGVLSIQRGRAGNAVPGSSVPPCTRDPTSQDSVYRVLRCSTHAAVPWRPSDGGEGRVTPLDQTRAHHNASDGGTSRSHTLAGISPSRTAYKITHKPSQREGADCVSTEAASRIGLTRYFSG